MQGWKTGYMKYKGHFLDVMSYYKKRESVKVYLELIMSLLTIIIFALFALKPTVETIASLVKEIDSKEETIIKIDAKIEDIRKAQAVAREQEDNIELLKKAVPEKIMPEVLAKQFESLYSKNQPDDITYTLGSVMVLGSQQQASTPTTQMQPLPANALGYPFVVNIEADYSRLASFLEDIENLLWIAKNDVLSISTSQVDQSKVITLRISGRVPYIPLVPVQASQN